jgi:hypothetical protein
MFGKRYAKTWFVLMLAAVVVSAPSLSVSAVPAADEAPGAGVLGAVGSMWQGWLQALELRLDGAPSWRTAADARYRPDPGAGTTALPEDGDAVTLRLVREDSPKLDPDG